MALIQSAGAVLYTFIDGVRHYVLVREKNGSYGLPKGHVEPGETLPQTALREVREETGLEIDNTRYAASQPWPFPSGLMIGFVAKYVSGEIKIQEEELIDAKFFKRDALPALPGKMSIARQLIDEWTGEA